MSHEHNIFLIKERIKRMSVEFEALKVAAGKLLADFKALQTENVNLRLQIANPPSADPAPAEVAALTDEINAALPPA